jgi:cell wall-associated NlpC family hydrolase
MNAIAGLVLALGAWVILNTINPNLAEDLNIKIPTVSLSIGDADSFSSSESTDSSGTITGNTPLPNIGLVCPMNGGSSSVASIIDSFENKTTYRWGGKGGPLPVGGRFKLSPSEQSGGPQTCTNSDGGQAECRSFCPIDSVCLDCSGFVNQVRRCSGLPTYSGTSSMVNNQDAIPVDMDNLSSDGQSIIINGAPYTLQSGDILVWNGHVVIYYGAGQIAESAGALTTNSNIKKSQLSSYVGKNRITHLIKVNP